VTTVREMGIPRHVPAAVKRMSAETVSLMSELKNAMRAFKMVKIRALQIIIPAVRHAAFNVNFKVLPADTAVMVLKTVLNNVTVWWRFKGLRIK
jgi:hypothetical protein